MFETLNLVNHFWIFKGQYEIEFTQFDAHQVTV